MAKTERKVRSDKRKDIKPTVDLDLYNCVSRISHITNTPMKNVAEHFCMSGLYSKKVIEHLSQKFRRDYKFNSTVFMGDPALPSNRVKRKLTSSARVTIRFRQDTYDQIADLAYAMDVTVSTTTAVLLEASIRNTDIVNEYVSDYIENTLDPNRKKQLQLVLEYIRKENPYETNEITLAQLLSYIMEGFMEQSRNVKKAVSDWLDKVTED